MRRLLLALVFIPMTAPVYAERNCTDYFSKQAYSTWTECTGTRTYSNGDVYEGDWKDGNFHGKGKHSWGSGEFSRDIYEGDHKDGKGHGKGKYSWASGTVYEGDFKDGIEHGKGKYTWTSGESSGDVYEGGVKNGKPHGKGKYSYAYGDVYEGDHKDGKGHGNGKFVVTLWEGYDDLVQQFYDIYVNDETTNPYMLQNNRAFPYVTKNKRLGFIMRGNTHENWIHFFDIRVKEPIYTGPKGINPATRGLPGFSEYYYLTENPEVSELVSAGNYSDGLAHYLAVGQNQGLMAFAKNARIHGSTSNDDIRLREGDESAFGYAGDDTFHTGAGNDSVDGGDGNDRVVYEAALSTFLIETDSNVVSITSNDGSTRDVLSNIEQFVFDSEVFTLTQLDTDGDGLGNNNDTDDDGDGFSDEQEALDGTDPLNRFSCNDCFDFDIDVDGDTGALTDGLLVLRHLFGFAGTTLTDDALASSATRSDSDTIASYLNANSGNLDIDGNGSAEALTDALLLLRYLFGFDGPTLIQGALGENAIRTSATEIRAFIEARISEGT